MSWDGSNYSSSGSEAVDANALDPFYTGLITTTRAATRDDMRILDIATEDCFGFLRKNFFDNWVSLQQYIICTGEESPRDLLTFCFNEDSRGKRVALGHNTVMEQLFRDIFIHKGSKLFHASERHARDGAREQTQTLSCKRATRERWGERTCASVMQMQRTDHLRKQAYATNQNNDKEAERHLQENKAHNMTGSLTVGRGRRRSLKTWDVSNSYLSFAILIYAGVCDDPNIGSRGASLFGCQAI